MDNWFHTILYNGCDYLSMLGFKFSHVSERGHWEEIIHADIKQNRRIWWCQAGPRKCQHGFTIHSLSITWYTNTDYHVTLLTQVLHKYPSRDIPTTSTCFNSMRSGDAIWRPRSGSTCGRGRHHVMTGMSIVLSSVFYSIHLRSISQELLTLSAKVRSEITLLND